MIRSLLFFPGNNPNMLINASALLSDALIFDLEDAVSPTEKDAARILVRNTLRYMDHGSAETVVRINSVDTAFWRSDVQAIIPERPSMLLLPKVGSAADVQELEREMARVEAECGVEVGSVGIIALIETALGVENAFQIATSSPRVRALFLGAEDLTADLRCKRTKEGREIEYSRQRLVVAARAAGIDVYDTPFTDVNDDEGIIKDAMLARALGFSGKAAISPRHVGAINDAFSPDEAEIEYAYEVIEAIDRAKAEGKGAIALRGKMIDAPIVARAERTIEMARALGLGRRQA